MILETNRLILREYTKKDFNDLYEVLSDKETMKYYPKPYDENGVNRWINWNLDNYKTFGFGLWAIVLKENNKFIGDCGITIQRINSKLKPEVGYHINKIYHRMGYGSEAAKACRDYIFKNSTFNEVYSYMNKENIGSKKVAINNGMKWVEDYLDEGVMHSVYKITRKEWNNIK